MPFRRIVSGAWILPLPGCRSVVIMGMIDKSVSSQPRLSAVIIAHNEEARLEDCLRSITGVVDEIVLIDDGSTDATVAIARSFGARVLTRPFDTAARQMNFGIRAARGQWILIIDADERLTRELADEIRQVLDAPEACQAYYFPRRNIVFGRWLRHGGNYPDYNSARLFLHGWAWFEDQPVHARLLLHGNAGYLRGQLLHLTAPTLEHYLGKFNAYTSFEAERMQNSGVRYSWLRMAGHALYHVVRRLVVQAAFLDGVAGLQYVFLGFMYDVIRYWKLRERQLRSPSSMAAPVRGTHAHRH